MVCGCDCVVWVEIYVGVFKWGRLLDCVMEMAVRGKRGVFDLAE